MSERTFVAQYREIVRIANKGAGEFLSDLETETTEGELFNHVLDYVERRTLGVYSDKDTASRRVLIRIVEDIVSERWKERGGESNVKIKF